jgi:hypothetical protein
MELIINSQHKREQHWHEVERYFNNLPPQLYQQGKLLKNKMSIQFSDTGKFSDILSSLENYPLLDLTFWLFDDFNFPEGQERRRLEKHLFLGYLFIFTSIYTQNLILDEDLFFDRDYLLLASLLSQNADKLFLHIFPPDSTFWDHHQNLWKAYAEARLVSSENYSGSNIVVTPEHILQRLDLLAPYHLIPLAIAILSGKEHYVKKLGTILENLHKLQIILHDLVNLPIDLQRGKFSYPILYTYAELGVPIGKGYTPESMLMAMTLIGSFSKIAKECKSLIDSCLAGASELKLSNLTAYFLALEMRVHDQFTIYSRKEKPDETIRAEQLEVISSKRVSTFDTNHLLKAIAMAEGYLLSDLTFKESWEVHRWGMVDEMVVTSRFPAGLIIEILCMHGHNLATQVDNFFRYTNDINFSYYDHKMLPYADSDTLGVLLRLYCYSANQAANQEVLELPLAWLRSSAEESGRIPVWIRGMRDIAVDGIQHIRLLGEGCGSIEAELLLGLCDYDWENYQNLIQVSAKQLLKRFIEYGNGITVNYPRIYCSWRIKQLLACLRTKPVTEELNDYIEEAIIIYPKYLEMETNLYRTTPQQAAFLMLACLHSPAKQLFNRRWVSILLSNQRSDGSWYGEPLFFVPNFGEYTTWHSSHQLTTAFCYQALNKYASDFM